MCGFLTSVNSNRFNKDFQGLNKGMPIPIVYQNNTARFRMPFIGLFLTIKGMS